MRSCVNVVSTACGLVGEGKKIHTDAAGCAAHCIMQAEFFAAPLPRLHDCYWVAATASTKPEPDSRLNALFEHEPTAEVSQPLLYCLEQPHALHHNYLRTRRSQRACKR